MEVPKGRCGVPNTFPTRNCKSPNPNLSFRKPDRSLFLRRSKRAHFLFILKEYFLTVKDVLNGCTSKNDLTKLALIVRRSKRMHLFSSNEHVNLLRRL